jgi:DNA-binding transcriptional LysR family regulator
MRAVDLSTIDLNLLVVLEALLIERQVTRAATRLRTSQPAVSRGLARLRALLDDQLLVRVGRETQLTPKGASLLGPLQTILGGVDEFLASRPFVPSSATGTVRLAAPDIVTYMLGPALLRCMAVEAPLLNVDAVQWSSAWREHLESGEIDLTFGQVRGREPGFYSRLLARNEWACVLRRGHPILRRPWSLEAYLDAPHLLIGFTSQGGGHVDAALAALGRTRRVALRMPYVILSPLMVAETDLVLTTARWLAEKLAHRVGLVVRDPPVALTPVDIPMVWHERSHRDPRQRWLRSTLQRLAREAGMLPAGHPPRG